MYDRLLLERGELNEGIWEHLNWKMQVKPVLFSKSLLAGTCHRTYLFKTVTAQFCRRHGTNSDTDQSSPFLLGSKLVGRFSMTC